MENENKQVEETTPKIVNLNEDMKNHKHDAESYQKMLDEQNAFLNNKKA